MEGRHHQDGQPGADLLAAQEELVAVHVGHHHVGEDGVEVGGLDAFEGLEAVAGGGHDAAVGFEDLLHGACDPEIVVGHEDAQALHARIGGAAFRPALREIDHLGRADVVDGLVAVTLRDLRQPVEDRRNAPDLPADGVEALGLHARVPLADDPLDVAFEQLGLVQDHGQRIVDLVAEPDRHLAQRRQLLPFQDLADVLGESDRAVLCAGVVVEDGAGDGDGNLRAVVGDVRGLDARGHAHAAELGAPHARHHALGLFEGQVELLHRCAHDLGGAVAEQLGGPVVVEGDGSTLLGGDHHVGRSSDQLLQAFLAEGHQTP